MNYIIILPSDLRKELCYFLNPITLSLIVKYENDFALGYCLTDKFWMNKISIDIGQMHKNIRHVSTHFDSSKELYIAYWTSLYIIGSRKESHIF